MHEHTRAQAREQLTLQQREALLRPCTREQLLTKRVYTIAPKRVEAHVLIRELTRRQSQQACTARLEMHADEMNRLQIIEHEGPSLCSMHNRAPTHDPRSIGSRLEHTDAIRAQVDDEIDTPGWHRILAPAPGNNPTPRPHAFDIGRKRRRRDVEMRLAGENAGKRSAHTAIDKATAGFSPALM